MFQISRLTTLIPIRTNLLIFNGLFWLSGSMYFSGAIIGYLLVIVVDDP